MRLRKGTVVNYGKAFVLGLFVVSVVVFCGCEFGQRGGGPGTFEAGLAGRGQKYRGGQDCFG